MNLGYKAAFDFSRSYFIPYVTPKFPDGTPLVDDSLWSTFVTDTTLYGHTFGNPEERAFSFAWRADTGLVRLSQDPETYNRLVSEAGPANVGLKHGDLGAKIVMDELKKLPEYSGQTCSTKLVTW